MGSLKLFGLAWLVWDVVAIGLRFGEATPAVAAAALGFLVAWWTRRVEPEMAPGRAITVACVAIIPADLCFIVFDVTLWDRTSHNLAPIELVYSLVMGSAIVAGLALVLRRLISARPGGRYFPALLAIVCVTLLLSAFIRIEQKPAPRIRPAAASDTITRGQRRLSADEVREVILSGVELGRSVAPSGKWEARSGAAYQIRYQRDGQAIYFVQGKDDLEITWRIKPSGKLCRGPGRRSRCRFIEVRGSDDGRDDYVAVGHRSGKVRYEFTIERGLITPD